MLKSALKKKPEDYPFRGRPKLEVPSCRYEVRNFITATAVTICIVDFMLPCLLQFLPSPEGQGHNPLPHGFEVSAMKQTMMLAFESSVFPHTPDEDGATHPGIFGRVLAYWLADRLRAAGVTAQKVFAEDFGWCVHVTAESQALYVVCASSPEGPNQWKVFAYAEDGVISKMFGRDKTSKRLIDLFQTLKECLEAEPVVENLRERSR